MRFTIYHTILIYPILSHFILIIITVPVEYDQIEKTTVSIFTVSTGYRYHTLMKATTLTSDISILIIPFYTVDIKDYYTL
jgi:hypothetical protein